MGAAWAHRAGRVLEHVVAVTEDLCGRGGRAEEEQEAAGRHGASGATRTQYGAVGPHSPPSWASTVESE